MERRCRENLGVLTGEILPGIILVVCQTSTVPSRFSAIWPSITGGNNEACLVGLVRA